VVQLDGKNITSIKPSLDFNCSSLGCLGALSEINNALDNKFYFLKTVFTDGLKLSWNHSVNTSRYPAIALAFVYDWRFWFLNALGLCHLTDYEHFKFLGATCI
jgi:hypothetical protein